MTILSTELCFWSLLFCGLAAIALYHRYFKCPAELRHLPQVPILPSLLSLARGEPESTRIVNIFLPVAATHRSNVVVAWTLGTWIVHVLDFEVGKQLMETRTIQKQLPPKEMLFWYLVGDNSVFFSKDAVWRKHSAILRPFITRAVPMDVFCQLSRKLISVLGEGGTVNWSDWAHLITLDAVGLAVMGFDFDALGNPDGPFVSLYHRVMGEISHPMDIDALVVLFRGMLDEKKACPGQDVLSSMLQTPEMTERELRDNTISLFMAGHDSTAGALTTLFYYLAIYPEHQSRARHEVDAILEKHSDPTVLDFEKMPFLQACIRESMRLNNSSTATIPRLVDEPLILDGKSVPPNTPTVLNLYASLHNSSRWYEPEMFLPNRFLSGTGSTHAWHPFSVGSRQCPAKNFSLYEQRTILSMVLREYEWTIPSDSLHKNGLRNSFSAFALNLPDNLYLIFKKRLLPDGTRVDCL